MSSRGSAATNGYIDTSQYETVDTIFEAKVLKGTSNQFHSLPDYSHSSEAIYIKYEEDNHSYQNLFFEKKYRKRE